MKTAKFSLLLSFVLLLTVACGNSSTNSAASSPGSDLYPVVQDGRWGYIDKSGKMVINPQFDYASRFSNGLALVGIGGKPSDGEWLYAGSKFGYIDSKGQYVVNPQYQYAAPFSEGLAAVMVDGKIGYIDTTGKVVITPQFNAFSRDSVVAMYFKEGLAMAAVGEKVGSAPYERTRMGFIDNTGKVVIEPRFDKVQPFSEGLAAVQVGNDWGYIDTKGQMIIKPQFGEAGFFSQGLATISIGSQWGYIDKTGKIVINPQFEFALSFSEDGLAGVAVNHKLGVIDKTGKMVIEPKFDGLGYELDPEIAPVCGFEIYPNYPFATEGLAAIRSNNKSGYIDATGKIVIPPQFDRAQPFCNGLAAVYLGDKIGYIDKTGKFVWSAPFKLKRPIFR